MTALTVLGMSITCCRCHNHPLEKWTQDQYWSLANLFSQVAIKNGDKVEAGDLVLMAALGSLLIGERNALRIISRITRGDEAIAPSGRPPNAANNILGFGPNLFASRAHRRTRTGRQDAAPVPRAAPDGGT